MALRLFLAVWFSVVTTAAVTNASAPLPCPVSVHAHPAYTTDKTGRRHYACARVNRPK